MRLVAMGNFDVQSVHLVALTFKEPGIVPGVGSDLRWKDISIKSHKSKTAFGVSGNNTIKSPCINVAPDIPRSRWTITPCKHIFVLFVGVDPVQ